MKQVLNAGKISKRRSRKECECSPCCGVSYRIAATDSAHIVTKMCPLRCSGLALACGVECQNEVTSRICEELATGYMYLNRFETSKQGCVTGYIGSYGTYSLPAIKSVPAAYRTGTEVRRTLLSDCGLS